MAPAETPPPRKTPINPPLPASPALAATVAAHAQDSSKIPIADFLRLPEVETAKLSPNGDYIASSRTVNDDKRAVGVTDLATNAMTATLAFDTGESVGQFWWANPKRLIFEMAVSYGRLDLPVSYGELIGIDANGKNHKYLFGYRGGDTAGSKIKVGAQARRAWAEMAATLAADPDRVLIQVRDWEGDRSYQD